MTLHLNPAPTMTPALSRYSAHGFVYRDRQLRSRACEPRPRGLLDLLVQGQKITGGDSESSLYFPHLRAIHSEATDILVRLLHLRKQKVQQRHTGLIFSWTSNSLPCISTHSHNHQVIHFHLIYCREPQGCRGINE